MNRNEGKTVLILDGQGGGIGAQLVKLLLPVLPENCRLDDYLQQAIAMACRELVQ